MAGAASLLAQGPASSTAPAAEPEQLGALARANLDKPRPKPPFDITGTWMHGGGPNNGSGSHRQGIKLTPTAQIQFDNNEKARKGGRFTGTISGSAGPPDCL